jgi:hypothetical protein
MMACDPFAAVLRYMRQPFAWGLRTDCTVACVAFEAMHGVDPLRNCGDSYNTALGAARIIKRAGGYRDWCRATFRLLEIDTPRAGDLALVESADAFGAALSICVTQGEYAMKSEAGMVITQAKHLGAWECLS